MRQLSATTLLGLILLGACSDPRDQAHPALLENQAACNLTLCTDAGLLLGMDVSKYDETVDFHAARDAGVVFAFARVSDGINTPDTYFDSNWANMKDAGVIRGVYQYFEPAQNPHTEAQLLLSHIPDFGPGDLPPVIDVEYLDNLDAGTAFAAVQAWVSDIQAATGRRPLIYTSQRVWDEYNEPALAADLWVVDVACACPRMPSAFYDAGFRFWQYNDSSDFPGNTAEATDLDRFNGSMEQLLAYAQTPSPDAGNNDAGNNDAGNVDAGNSDAGDIDAGIPDAGDIDAGVIDAGMIDAGSTDAGVALNPRLLSPAPGQTLSGPVLLEATADGAADSVEIFLDDALLAQGDGGVILQAPWNTALGASGTHHLKVKAFAGSHEEETPEIAEFVAPPVDENPPASGCNSENAGAMALLGLFALANQLWRRSAAQRRIARAGGAG